MKLRPVLASLGFITTAVILGQLLGLGVVDAQSEKKVIKLTDTVKPQVRFTEVKVGTESMRFGESFDAAPDWIKDISFTVESVAKKPIVFLQVNVNFPETRGTGNLMSYALKFGEIPGRSIRDSNPISLKPGETLEISLENEKDKIYKFVNERQPIQLLQKVELEIGFIVFEDKTAWSAGTFTRQDPNNPDLYKPVENEELKQP